MLGLPHRSSLRRLASCLPPQLRRGWHVPVLGSLHPPRKRSAASGLAFLPQPCADKSATALLWLLCPALPAPPHPTPGSSTGGPTALSVLTPSTYTAGRLFPSLTSSGLLLDLCAQRSCHLLTFEAYSFAPWVYSSPHFTPTCSHLASCSPGGFLALWLSCQAFLPKSCLRSRTHTHCPEFL